MRNERHQIDCPVRPYSSVEYGKYPRSSADVRKEQVASWDREYAAAHPKWKGPARGDPGLTMEGRVLELGCGNGKTAAALVRDASSVVALDFSRKGLEACRAAVRSPKLDVILGDLCSLPLADRSFDHVVASHVLGHLLEGERTEALEEIARVLVPGGRLLFRAFSVRDMRFGQGREVERNTFQRGTGIRNHFFERDEIRLLTSGFEEIAMEEIVSRKRYDGEERTRAEWAGTFRARIAL